jgi:flagellar protein FlaJ
MKRQSKKSQVPPTPYDPIPLMPIPYAPVKGIVHGYYPLAAILLKFLPTLDMELGDAKSRFSAKEYLSGALFTFTIYLIAFGSIMGLWALRNNLLGESRIRILIVLFAFSIALAILTYILIYPRWKSAKLKGELEKNLLFAIRHMMIQTNAGVPLFDSIVSISEEYADEFFNYGAISAEFKKIVKEVKSGTELSDALEASAIRNPSTYYRRTLWQLANANRSGANMNYVLKDMVEFLSNEQRIAIRNYGSQLNPLALFYLFTCIIAPTMGIIFISITVTISNANISDTFFWAILVLLAVVQMVFIGLIKSRRPVVAI